MLALDYHQVLDRSRTETAWAVQRVPRENFELIRKLKADLGDRLIICVCSHIERSEKNLRDLIRCLHNTDGIQNLIEFVTITTQRTGALGNLGSHLITKNALPSTISRFSRFPRPFNVFPRPNAHFFRAKSCFHGHILIPRPTVFSKPFGQTALASFFAIKRPPRKLSTLAAICQKRVPCMIIDDNAE